MSINAKQRKFDQKRVKKCDEFSSVIIETYETRKLREISKSLGNIRDTRLTLVCAPV